MKVRTAEFPLDCDQSLFCEVREEQQKRTDASRAERRSRRRRTSSLADLPAKGLLPIITPFTVKY